MSKVAIQGNASGTGTFTIAAPDSNNNNTLTLPDEAGTVLTSATDIAATATNVVQNAGNVFWAYNTTDQYGDPSEWTKLQFNAEIFDPDNVYDTSTYRFTPNIAGYYQISAGTKGDDSTTFHIEIYKNNSGYLRIFFEDATGQGGYGGGLVYANGSTDYFEIYSYHSGGSNKRIAYTGSNVAFFQACLVRGA